MRLALLLVLLATQAFAEEKQWEFMPQASVFSPSDFLLSSPSTSVRFIGDLAGIPVFSATVGRRVVQWSNFNVYLQGQMGYGFKEGQYSVDFSDRGIVDELRLHYIPTTAAVRIVYVHPDLSFVRPTLTAGVGGSWILQQGSFAETSESYWIPTTTLSAGLAFYNPASAADAFPGFSFSISRIDSLFSTQILRGWSVDLALHFRI